MPELFYPPANPTSINGSTGSIVVTAGSNITLSQNASSITIIGASQSIQTQNSVAINGSTGNIILSTLQLYASGNTEGTTQALSSGSIVLAGGNNITLSQDHNTVTIIGGAGGGGGSFSAGISGGNTSGNTGTVSNEIVLAGGNNITLSGSTNAGGMSVTISAQNTSQSIQTQNSIQVNGSSGSIVLTAGNNITLSQNASTITISAANQSVQTQNSIQVNGSSGSIVFTAGNNITLSQNASTITVSAANQSVQSQNLVDISLSGNTAGVLTLISSGTAILAGGNNVTISQNGQSITISAFNQTVQTQNLVSVNGSTGNISFVAGPNISLSQNASTITISASNQSVQTQNNVDVSLSGNTAGVLTLVSSGTVIFAGGNNITLSQNGQSITISGPNAGGAQTGISGLQVSNTTYTSGTVTFQNANGISFGSSGANGISASYTVPVQTVQTVGVYASSQTVGQSSSSTFDARSITFAGQGIISVGESGGSILLSATTLQTNQSIGIYGSSQTYGQSSSSTVDARSLSVVGQGAISVGMSAGSLMLSVAPGAQSNQTIGVYASSQTVGQSSSSTIDARSFTHVGQGIVSVGLSGGSLLISASTSQSVQTQNVIDLSLSGNTAGALALISSGTGILAGGNNITLSQNGQSVTISGPNTVAQTNQSIGLYASSQTYGQSSSSTVDARSLSIVAQGAISAGLSGGSLVLSVSTGAQSNQTLSFAATGNTTGNTSGVSVDARSLTLQGLGVVSVGMSTSAGGTSLIVSAVQTVQTQNLMTVNNTQGNVTISGGANVTVGNNASTITISVNAQSNQSIGFYASSQTYGQSSSSTVDARSISIVGQGGISAGMSGGSLLISGQTTVAQTNETLSFAFISQTVGNTSGVSVDVRSLTLQGRGAISVGASTSAGGTSIVISAPNTIAQTVQTLGLYASSQTVGQSSSSTVDARSITFVGQGVASVGMSGGSVLISVPSGGGGGFTGGFSTLGNTSGNTAMVSNQMVLAGINNVTLSGSTGANSITISISGPTISTAQLVAAGNTSGTLVTLSSGFLSLAGGNNITLSQDGTNQVITISANIPTMSYWNNIGVGSGNQLQPIALSASSRSLFVFPLDPLREIFPASMTVSTVRMLVSVIGSTASISVAETFGISLGIYQLSATSGTGVSVLSLLNSVGSSLTNTTLATLTASNAYDGIRWLTFHSSQWSVQPQFSLNGMYFGALLFSWSSISFASFNMLGGLNMSGGNNSSNNPIGTFGNTATQNNTSNGFYAYGGVYSVTTNGIPTSINISQLNKQASNANFIPYLEFDNLLSVH